MRLQRHDEPRNRVEVRFMVTSRPRSRWSTGVSVVGIAAALGLAACGGSADSGQGTPNLEERMAPRDTGRALPERVPDARPTGEPAQLPESLTELVLADAARRTGLDLDALTVRESWRVTWNDGSLGCPQPGMNYTQALVQGWRALVQAGEQTLDYRIGGERYFFVCEAGKPGLNGARNERGPSGEGPPGS
jgi:hypothetical protein